MSKPLVLDADDIMTEQKVMVIFCEIIGMDPTKLKLVKWASNAECLREVTFAKSLSAKSLSAIDSWRDFPTQITSKLTICVKDKLLQ